MRTSWLIGWCGCLLLLAALPAAAQEPGKPADQGASAEDQGAPPAQDTAGGRQAGLSPEEKKAAWRQDQERQIQRQVKDFAAAYQLDERMQQELLGELRGRLTAELDAQRQMVAAAKAVAEKLKTGEIKQGSPEARAAFAGVQKAVDTRPLDDEVVADWVESKLPPESAAEGRARVREIWAKREAVARAQYTDAARGSGSSAAFTRGRTEEAATTTSTGAPKPNGPKGREIEGEEQKSKGAAVVQPNQGVAGATPAAAAAGAAPPPKPGEAGKPAETKPPLAKTPGESKVDPRPQAQPQPGAAAPPPPRPQPPVAMPQPQPPPKVAPLDEWDNYVIQVSGKYRFTDAQVTKAQAILRDLRRRAYQYRVSRAADFSRVELITDAKVKQTRLGELNRPLAAMFEELKQRLESLPTSEQRQHAEAGVKKPVGKK